MCLSTTTFSWMLNLVLFFEYSTVLIWIEMEGTCTFNLKFNWIEEGGGVMVFNATFKNILVISWQSVLLVEETWVPDKLDHIILYCVHFALAGFELTTPIRSRPWQPLTEIQNVQGPFNLKWIGWGSTVHMTFVLSFIDFKRTT